MRASTHLAGLLLLLCGCEAGEPPPRASRDPFNLTPRKAARPSAPSILLPAETAVPASSAEPPLSPARRGAPPAAPGKPEAPHDDASSPASAECPKEMVLVHGDACPDARQDCLRWIDPDTPPFPRKRCGEFVKPSRCVGERRHLRFCIDRYEYAKTPGDVPVSDLSWTAAKAECEAQGKRLCQEPEWVFACEGEEMLPYPTGFTRPTEACNFDRDDLVDEKGKMRDHRKPGSSLSGCKSPFGVYNLVGNVDEWTWREGTVHHTPWRAALKGGWWLAGRNRCRPATTGHDEYYHDLQTGFRCCKDAAPEKPPAAQGTLGVRRLLFVSG